MKMPKIPARLSVMVLFCSVVFASVNEETVTEKRAEVLGFSVAARPGENGSISYTITRRQTRTNHDVVFTERGRRLVGTLTIRDAKGTVAECDVQRHEVNETVSYSFSLSREYVVKSDFIVYSYLVDHDGKQTSDGWSFKFRLADIKVSNPAPN